MDCLVAHEAIDRHVLAGRGDNLALRWIGRDERVRDFTYAGLGAALDRFANVLAQRESPRVNEFSRCSAAYPSFTLPLSGRSRTAASFRLCSRRSGRNRSKRV